jgi:citrate lyase beta subunit
VTDAATPGRLPPELLTDLDERLRSTDALLRDAYPGEDGRRQPVHTVYVPADSYTADLPRQWGDQALDLVTEHGGADRLCRELGLDEELSAGVGPRVQAKLQQEPIEDLRIDFEDGYGNRPDDQEDAEAVRAARELASSILEGRAPSFVGLRFKCFEEPTRRRGVRTLDLFVSTLLDRGGLPDGLVITFPKVSTVSQVEAMVAVCEAYETNAGLPPGRLRFEIQVETPQLIMGADGRHPVAAAIAAGRGRVSSLHYGTFDYSASLQIAAQFQSPAHPAADFAKQVMQVAVAGTGVHLSDGSTNVLPVGSPEQVLAAWRLHHDLVRRSLERGYYQGWDMHPGHLPTRFIATFAFFRSGFRRAAGRLAAYLAKQGGDVLDEPATARALARYLHRGAVCGALDAAELAAATGLDTDRLERLARPKSDTESLSPARPVHSPRSTDETAAKE